VTEPTDGVLYADTSALVKLVVREAESDDLETEVSRWDRIAASDIVSIELSRAAARARSEGRADVESRSVQRRRRALEPAELEDPEVPAQHGD
jgi:predicted nucleic acid-binding protein